MRAKVANFKREVFVASTPSRRSEAIYRIGFEELGRHPFDSLTDMARVAPTP